MEEWNNTQTATDVHCYRKPTNGLGNSYIVCMYAYICIIGSHKMKGADCDVYAIEMLKQMYSFLSWVK